MSIPWGDVVTAAYSTGIANISVFVPAPKPMIRVLRGLDWLRPLLGAAWLQRALVALVERWVKGPTAEQRASLHTQVWGEVRNAAGAVKVGQLQTSNGYALTVHSALHVVQALLAEAPAGGYYTPAQLLGWQLVEHLPDCGKIVIH
jgi:short subunit dehydrogenase-like uncharacterized protein